MAATTNDLAADTVTAISRPPNKVFFKDSSPIISISRCSSAFLIKNGVTDELKQAVFTSAVMSRKHAEIKFLGDDTVCLCLRAPS